jgi:hypothetical protein
MGLEGLGKTISHPSEDEAGALGLGVPPASDLTCVSLSRKVTPAG